MGYHGKSDWGLQLKKTLYSFDDLSELAVRLGSISQFDRRGDVILLDSFENGTGKWALSGNGTGNKQLLIAEKTRSGGYSLKLIGGKTTPYSAQITGYFSFPVLSKWGFEAHFLMSSSIDNIVFTITAYTGSQFIQGRIKYDDANDKLQYYGSDGKYHDILTDFELFHNVYLFHTIKLVVDLSNAKYHRLILNDQTYDLSAYDMESYSFPYFSYMIADIILYSRDDFNDYACIDNIILTQNEP